MKWLSLFLLFCPVCLYAQNGDFTFGAISPGALYMERYDKDTTANAVVLKEFGRTSIDNNQKNILVHFYHVRIKILNDRAVNKANFVIPIHKYSSGSESVYDIKGSTFNAGADEARLRLKNVFTENKSRYVDLVKFTLPNVRAGSVIEVEYTLSSPYIFNFREWKFQSDIPKVYSEYWAKIPANFDYHVSLVGYYKLTENERSRLKDCLTTFNGGRADCAVLKLGMKDIPAFREEKYMTAKSNFLSSVQFELAAVHGFNGNIDKVTKTWEDVDDELQHGKAFGIQLKRGVSFFRKALDTLFIKRDDELTKAKKVYAFFQKWYKWDRYTGIYCESGIKKAFENHSGNIGDINLSLIAALRAAGLKACPVLVSTRDNGLPHDLYPVISDFNYVLARLQTEEDVYLLDASQQELPFGVFPMNCINGRGRVLYQDKPSAWMPVAAPVIRKAMYIADLTLDKQGNIAGTITRNYEGYFALSKRREIHGFNSKEEYLEELNRHWTEVQVLEDSIAYLDAPDKPLVEVMKVRLRTGLDAANNRIVFNPFFQSFIKDNPFKLTERHFPVDFGAPRELYTVLTLHYPSGYQVTSAPKKSSLALPDKGGKYILYKSSFNKEIIVKTLVKQKKPVYNAEEYPALKEFYNRIIQSQRAGIIFSQSNTSSEL